MEITKEIAQKALEKLLQSPEWKIVKSQLEEEKRNLNNLMMQNAINWNEGQIKASIEAQKVYDNILTCPERLFTSFGGQLQVEE